MLKISASLPRSLEKKFALTFANASSETGIFSTAFRTFSCCHWLWCALRRWKLLLRQWNHSQRSPTIFARRCARTHLCPRSGGCHFYWSREVRQWLVDVVPDEPTVGVVDLNFADRLPNTRYAVNVLQHYYFDEVYWANHWLTPNFLFVQTGHLIAYEAPVDCCVYFPQ